MLASRGLPGIRIDIAPPPLTEVLPRMDVAVFVGFAATGPTHLPVAVESVAQYAAVFGPDAPLAWDGERNERLYANLGAAVRAFFSNGGRRCWVIRAARTATLEAAWRGLPQSATPPGVAATNRFALPGVLVAPGNGGPLAAAMVQARSVGSWSDPLRVETALVASSFTLTQCAAIPSSPPQARIRFLTQTPLQPADMIELHDPAAPISGGLRVYAAIDQVVAGASAGSSAQQVDATICAAFESLDAQLSSPPLSGAGTVEIAGANSGAVAATLEINSSSDLAARLRLSGAVPAGVAEGAWARWSDGLSVVWLRVDALDRVACTLDGAAWQEAPLQLPAAAPISASILTLDLRVVSPPDSAVRLNGVGLTPAHDAGWWRQTSDDVLYAPTSVFAPAAQPAPVAAARFPLAALDQEVVIAPRAWIPLGATSFGPLLGPLPQPATALERDGLASFNAELFLDPELAPLGIDALIEHADVIRYFGSEPRSLFGAHASLSIGEGGLYNEATLLALPDAVHIGWAKRGDVHPPPATPPQTPPPAHWFAHRGPCAAVPKDATATEPDFGQFLDCGTHALKTPQLNGPDATVPRGPFQLTWSPSDAGAEYVLSEAQLPDFADAREVFRGQGFAADIEATREGIFYYRINAVAGDERSADSNVVTVVVRDDDWVQAAPADFAAGGEGELVRVHRAALRLAAASGELFAVLGLPRHYRPHDAINYASRLRAERGVSAPIDPDTFDFDERRALSYGALYHPWAAFGAAADQTPASGTALRACPPDGLAAGVLAARAARRGAWIAPANEPFKDVVALDPPIEPEAWLALQDAQVNLIRDDARGFLTLAADTLSDELEWRPINVRRLLILLRRLALRRGVSYVFEPNGDTLRRSVQRGFTLLLTDLFRRGAFAGATADDSFRVVTNGAINTSADRDNGRFLVELRVAPSLPLQFLTVRLVQTGERLTVAEGL